MPVTIRDIARESGVHISTVSRAFSAPHRVNPETRRKVLDCAEHLGYQPNRAARSLAKGRTGMIGVVVPDIVNPFYADIVKAVEARARRKGFAVLLLDTDEQADDEHELIGPLSQQADGVIVAGSRLSPEELAETCAGFPTVLVVRSAPGIPSIIAPPGRGMDQAIEHLYALGHRRICYLAHETWVKEDEREAMRAITTRLGMELIELFDVVEPKYEAGVAATDRIVARGATAVIAHNDLTALGVMSRLAQRGVSVPHDFSVIGVDDTFMARLPHPQLTSIHLPLNEMGSKAVDVMVDMISGGEVAPDVIKLSAGLIVRGSTGRAPAAAAGRAAGDALLQEQ